MKNSKGFTMVELLAVIVILGILLSMGISSYSRYRLQAIEQSYDTMSKSASSAAEEYFMDHLAATSVDFKTLVDEEYLKETVDPAKKEKNCTGEVSKYNIRKGDGRKLDFISYKVEMNCFKHEACHVYPGGIPCSAEDGITTDGKDMNFSLGFSDYDFKNAISLVIRVKFNELEQKLTEYFGNWENAGGGLGIKADDRFYFNLYNHNSNRYISFDSTKIANEDQWYIVTGVLSEGTMKLYLNGVPLKTNSGATTVPFGGNVRISPLDFLVGGNPSSDSSLYHPAKITVSDALIYNRGLTAAEVGNNFSNPDGGIGVINNGLLVHQNFRE